MLGLRLGLQLVLYDLQRVNVRIAVIGTACVYGLQSVNARIAVRVIACVVWSATS